MGHKDDLDAVGLLKVHVLALGMLTAIRKSLDLIGQRKGYRLVDNTTLRIANRYAIPIYAISTGKNLGYGGSAPNQSGSVVLDLKRMNRIIQVNESNHYCIVEPGAATSTCTTTSRNVD